jgi:hypothetical protein
MTRDKTITRKTLVSYASVLGEDSLAANCLKTYDTVTQDKGAPKVTIIMTNNGFRLKYIDGRTQNFG